MSRPPLSPAARAVLAAMHRSYDHEPTRRAIAAGILRAVADQVVPAQLNLMHPVAQAKAENIRADILAIAAELKGADG